MTTKLLPVNDAKGIFTMRRITPIMNALFGFIWSEKMNSSKNKFYVARRSNKIQPIWKQVCEYLAIRPANVFDTNLRGLLTQQIAIVLPQAAAARYTAL